MSPKEKILYEALVAIATIKTTDPAQYVKQADQIAVDALVEHECYEETP